VKKYTRLVYICQSYRKNRSSTFYDPLCYVRQCIRYCASHRNLGINIIAMR